MKTRMRMFLTATLLCGLSSALSCSYTPDFDNGTLACGPSRNCPKGYACSSDNLCWKSGAAPDGGSSDPLEAYVGTWTFATGNLNSSCSDGQPTTSPLSGDTVKVTKSGTGLKASYFCDWILHRKAGFTAEIDPGQSCMQPVQDPNTNVTYTYTWSSTLFSFTTTDGQTATLMGQVSGPFTATSGATGTCNGVFDGTLSYTGP